MWFKWKHSIVAGLLLVLCGLVVDAKTAEEATVDDVEYGSEGRHVRGRDVTDDDTSHVLVYDADGFLSEIDNKRIHFVMFYKTQTPDISGLEETFNQLAKKFNTIESMERVALSRVACHVTSELCDDVVMSEDVVLVTYGKNGSRQSVYSGKRDYVSLNRFLEEISGVYTEYEQEISYPTPKKFLVDLTEDRFDEQIAFGDHFVKFYAPWCGHCQRLAPAWEELAKTFEHEDWLTISKVDCTQFNNLCVKNKVRSYPTLIYFQDGRQLEEYNGARDHNTLKQYVLKNKHGFGTDEEQFTADGLPIRDYVITLTNETFSSSISKGVNFVMFFDPECIFCKTLASDWKSLALLFIQQGVTFFKLDCTHYSNICANQAVYNFPTLVLFKDGRRLEKYDGLFNYDALKEFIMLLKDKSADDGILPEQVSFVVNLEQSNFRHYFENGYCLVNFFKPWCEFCRNLAPVWEELAIKLSMEIGVTIAKVDCSVSDLMCEQFGIKGFPTIVLYHNGERKDIYTGSHDLESLDSYLFAHLYHLEF